MSIFRSSLQRLYFCVLHWFIKYGYGLGLSIGKELVNLMNGSIDVRMNDYMSKPIDINKSLGILAKYRRIWCGIRFFLTQWVHIQFDSASLHLTDAAFAASPKKEQVLSESKLSLEPVPFLVYVDSLLTHKKSTIPVVALQKRYPQMRDQGLEPWTPWLRVRCSSNWANRA